MAAQDFPPDTVIQLLFFTDSKTLFLSLAKKFSLSKKSLNEAHWPAEMGRQASEELDFGNSAMLKPYSSDPNYSVGGSESTKRNRNRKCS